MDEVDASLKNWRQGDLLFDTDLPFVTFAHSSLPLTKVSQESAEHNEQDQLVIDVLSDELGYAVVSQSCDIVRTCADRQYVEIAPLVPVDQSTMNHVLRGRSERYAAHPLAGENLVVDLDRVMVVEKPVVAVLDAVCRRSGLDDKQRRQFAQALARKRGRFAFPDDFVTAVRRLRDLITAKHGKDSPLGGFLSAVAEIRMLCPEWEAAEPEVVMLFVFEKESEVPADAKKQAAELAKRFTPTGGFKALVVQIATFETMSAARYRATDLLELDFLSQAKQAND